MVRFIKKRGHKVELLPLPGTGEAIQCLQCKAVFSPGAHRRCIYIKCRHMCCLECVKTCETGCGECTKQEVPAKNSVKKVSLKARNSSGLNKKSNGTANDQRTSKRSCRALSSPSLKTSKSMMGGKSRQNVKASLEDNKKKQPRKKQREPSTDSNFSSDNSSFESSWSSSLSEVSIASKSARRSLRCRSVAPTPSSAFRIPETVAPFKQPNLPKGRIKRQREPSIESNFSSHNNNSCEVNPENSETSFVRRSSRVRVTRSRASSPARNEFSLPLRRPLSPTRSEISSTSSMRPQTSREASPAQSDFWTLPNKRAPRARAVSPAQSDFWTLPNKRAPRARAVSPAQSDFWTLPNKRAPRTRAVSPAQSDFWTTPRQRAPRARAVSPARSGFWTSPRQRATREVSPAPSEFSMSLRPRTFQLPFQSPTNSELSSSQETVQYSRRSIVQSLTQVQNQMSSPTSPSPVKKRGRPRKILTDENNNNNNENANPRIPKPKVMGPQCLRCIHCDETFSDKVSKSEHLQMLHQKERPHQCSYCNVRFVGRQDLARHILKHTMEKPHQCSICNAAFTRTYTLKMHIQAKHMEKNA